MLVHYLLNEHYRVIRSVKELATEVGKEKTINNWYYLYTLGKMLPSHDQCKLFICECNLALDFITLERDFWNLMNSFTEMSYSPEPEANQVQSELVKELDEKEPK